MSEPKLTKAQQRMMGELRATYDGIAMFDGNEARVASALAKKGLVNLPAGHGYYFGSHIQKVRLTDLGRAALSHMEVKR